MAGGPVLVYSVTPAQLDYCAASPASPLAGQRQRQPGERRSGGLPQQQRRCGKGIDNLALVVVAKPNPWRQLTSWRQKRSRGMPSMIGRRL